MTPSKQERIFLPEYAFELMRIAQGDYNTAVALITAKNIRIENAFFMAQQAAEKALKAVLVSKKLAVPMVHDLGSLLSRIPKEIEPPYGYELNELNQYAAIRRYEEGPWIPSQEELEVVIQKTLEVLNWANNIVNPPVK